MSKIEVDTIAPQSGTTVTLGEAGDTVNIPSGVTLTNSGTATGFGISWQSDIKTSAFTAVAGEGYWINTTSAAVTVTLPASASVGDTIEFTDYARTWGTNNLTINQNSLNYQGYTSPNPVYDVNGQHVRIVYSGATQGWIPTVDDDVTNEVPQTVSIDFLVVAGGGGGGNDDGGGGGAGGYRTSTQSISPGTAITVTVGDGGAGNGGPSSSGADGSDSSISGTGITTITSSGGGGGSTGGGQNARNGGSGGGGGGTTMPSPGGSGNTPSTSPSQGNNGGDGATSPQRGGGGGGGAGEAGNTDGHSYGGDGTSNSITGSAVFYAGGGGGSTRVDGTQRPGGDGGGGAGGTDTPQTTASDATANTGGGGGGGAGNTPQTGGDGGKGVVILSVPTADYTGTTTGSPTVTTSGSNTIMQFNGSGSYTT
jgi:hypothetical protein